MSILYIPVAGTNGWSDDSNELDSYGQRNIRWWQDSMFYFFMKEHGFDVPNRRDPFVWTTDLGGVQFWRRFPIFKGKINQIRDHRDWIAGAAALRWYCKAHVPLEVPVSIIAHSHGLQVVAYACDQGLVVDNLITVGSPIRDDMKHLYKCIRDSEIRWLHISDGNNDRIQLAGQFGDGIFTRRRHNIYANFNNPLLNISHSRILSDPDAFHYWTDLGWLNFLRTGWKERDL